MKTVAVGVIGYGTVGQGVVEVLTRNAAEIERRCGYHLKVTKVARRSWAGIDTTKLPFACVENGLEVASDPDIDVVLELVGGEDAARTFIDAAFENGKHVVTANKALIAKQGQELFACARDNGLELAYEAAVAGGIPIIKVLREGMSGNEISEVAGIINGTGNFILSEMTQKKRPFADVLAEAQRLGYAEADPTYDIEGIDAAHKITILASIAFGIPLQFEKTYIEGITNITPLDIDIADELGYAIKHLGLAVRRDDGVEIRVHPTLIPKHALLSSVNGVMNAVQVKGNAIGNSLHYGPGAGKLPTASAVIADLIDVVRELNLAQSDRLAEFGFNTLLDTDTLPVLPPSSFISAYYLSLLVEDRSGVVADITRILADYGISIRSMIQKSALRSADHVPLILLTETIEEQRIDDAIRAIATLDCMRGAIKRLRVEDIE